MDEPHNDDPTPSPRRPRVTACWLVPMVLAGLVLVQTWWFRAGTCETFDEFTYLRLGIRIFRYGDVTSLSSPMCPPLPILLEYWLPSLRARSVPEEPGWDWEVPRLIRQARLLTSVSIGVPLVLVVYVWMARRRGWPAGALAGGFVALSPSVLAAAAIATTDACFVLFALVALAALCAYQARPSRNTFWCAGAALGLALGGKQSAVVLAPTTLLILVLQAPRRQLGKTMADHVLITVWRVGWRFAALWAIAFGVDWALYGFGLGPPFRVGQDHVGIPVMVPMVAALFPNYEAIMDRVRAIGPPLALDTFLGQIEHATTGHCAFLMGQWSNRGWWYFFPVAVALKSTPAELVLIALTLLAALRPTSWRDPTRRVWLSAFLAMIGMGMASHLNIGQRYMLLLYPLAVLVATDQLSALVASRSRRWWMIHSWLAAGLLAWQAISAVGIAPHYLSYFNSFCGGPRAGYRYLVDSSLDWGQDLPSLRRELEARGYHKVALAYFGTAQARVYGLRSVGWSQGDDPAAAGCDWLAISATVLQGTNNGLSALSERFRDLPVVRVGYSIFLYDLKDPRVRAAIAANRISHPR